MLFSGIQPFTLLDFPGRIACIAFLPGCNFRCGYCYNSDFVLPEKIKCIASSFIPENIFFQFLEKRKKLLDGVVISGGEPTLSAGLESTIRQIREYGFQVKLDTNGSNPKILERLLIENLIDYVAMDIKAPLKRYSQVIASPIDTQNIEKSIQILLKSNIDYEFRSTLIPYLHSPEDIVDMAKMISGAPKYFLQNFKAKDSVLDVKFMKKRSFTHEALIEISKQCQKYVVSCEVRL